MSFQKSSRHIRIDVRDDYTVLIAGVDTGNGRYITAELNLDEGIGNTDGYFSRASTDFTQSAQDINLTFRYDGIWLEAELPTFNGDYRERQGVNLSEHVENQNGTLVFI